MRSYLVWLCLLSAMLLLACNLSTQTTNTKQDTVVKVADTITSPTDTVPVIDTTANDCPRDKSQPIINKTVFPDSRFALQADGRTGIETLKLSNGDQVTITQSGCEYFTLKFRFETSRFAADTTNIPYWSNAALIFMRKLNKGLDVPLDIAKALDKLSARIEKDRSAAQKKLELDEEIDFGGSDPREYLVIERITQLAVRRFAVELSLSYGPM